MNRDLWAVISNKDKVVLAMVLITKREKTFDQDIRFRLDGRTYVMEWPVRGKATPGYAVLHHGDKGPIFGRGYYVSCVEKPPEITESEQQRIAII